MNLIADVLDKLMFPEYKLLQTIDVALFEIFS